VKTVNDLLRDEHQ